MPPLAAAVPAIIGAAGAITLEGLAIGATIVGTSMQAIGMATGSKTLQKVGTGFSMAGGLGLATSSIKNMSSSPKVTGSASKSKGLLETDNMDDMLSAPTKGTKNAQDFKTFDSAGAQTSNINGFNNDTKLIGSGTIANNGPANTTSPTTFDPELEKSFFQRANATLTNYNPLMNIMGGVGDAYMVNENMDLQRELLDKRLGIDQQLIDRVNKNNGTLLNTTPGVGLTRNTNAYTPLLRGQ